MSSLEDFHECEHYFSHKKHKRPCRKCLKRNKSRLIAAVIENNVDILRELLDSPKLYNVKDENGDSLLHIAILYNNKEVFDYMLSIRDFPIELVNKKNLTALKMTLTDLQGRFEYFAYELIKMGASIDFVTQRARNTPLHLALHRSYNTVALLLIRMGVDVDARNREGDSPISVALSELEDVTEVCTALLVEGAVASIRDFEDSVLCNWPPIVQELLFLHTVDQYSKIDFHIVLHLAEQKSHLFHEILESSCKIILGNYYLDSCVYTDLYTMGTDYLVLTIKRFRNFIAELLRNTKRHRFNNNIIFQIENLDMLLENGFDFDVIDSLGMTYEGELFKHLFKLDCWDSYYLYFLSHGLVPCDQDLQQVYEEYDYCELFKLLLHMEYVEEEDDDGFVNKDIMPVFIYDITMTIPKFLKNYQDYHFENVFELFDYFVHPGLTELCYHLRSRYLIDVFPRKMIQMPSLLELARNTFRSHFIDTFKIKTTRMFYTLLKHLPVDNVYKKIISYETKIY